MVLAIFVMDQLYLANDFPASADHILTFSRDDFRIVPIIEFLRHFFLDGEASLQNATA
jgi:hypothetical protein